MHRRCAAVALRETEAGHLPPVRFGSYLPLVIPGSADATASLWLARELAPPAGRSGLLSLANLDADGAVLGQCWCYRFDVPPLVDALLRLSTHPVMYPPVRAEDM